MTPLYRHFFPILRKFTPVQTVVERAAKATEQSRILTGLPASLDAVLAAYLCKTMARSVLVVVEESEQAERLYDDLARLLDDTELALFSEGAHGSLLARERQKRTQTAETAAQLLEAIEHLSSASMPLVTIADAESLTLQLPQKDRFAGEALDVATGEVVGFQRVRRWLDEHHFEERQFVESAGDFAVRGGIIDVFPFTETQPFRLEFFGETVESIRAFDAISQRSILERSKLRLVPNAITDSDEQRDALLFDYLSADVIAIVEEPERVRAEVEGVGAEVDVMTPLAALRPFEVMTFSAPGADVIDFGAHPQPSFNANLKQLREHMAHRVRAGEQITIMSESRDLTKRLKDLLDVDEVTSPEPGATVVTSDGQLEAVGNRAGHIAYLEPSLAHGFVLPAAMHTAIYSEHEFFGRRRERGASAKKKAARTKGISLRELRSLKRGDFLVHEDKGIGKFMGLEAIEVHGKKQEVVRLSYRDNDVLFVNLDYIGKLSKYSAGEALEAPHLSKLGSAEWQRTKERTKKRLKDIARNLISLYAKRKTAEGFAFSSDDILQREMEAAFLYDDTPDQTRATEEVKQDMESTHPMDRLVCGDVGFGKTEVAMRAGMKAVLDKKQVAVLVPTTILAEQHYRSFKDRLERFGVRCASLSRFRSRAEQTVILKDLIDGKIDVLIGTHRILSKDVQFKDLGLLVIDEEHRFGVAAKEKLREVRANIDTLTLTATPIPRTLNFSLLGARDLSVMETPPKNRLPIVTEVLSGFQDDAVRQAITRELARGGQVYAINDKVGDIDSLANKLRELAPRARVGIIHGQMPPTSIEKVLQQFLERKLDVLVATKIVESGLDVPNANTMIINHSQNFGLAELYQLRGRVGRSNEQAYCYLISPPVNMLTQDAIRRLEAMEEFSALGAGFQLAMRDLEIRGAGNLLGAEQSGFIADIGFELYQKIVEEAVDELKREEFSELFKDDLLREQHTAFGRKRIASEQDVVVSLGVDALIPEDYISDDAERFRFYQRMAVAEDEATLQELSTELKDRFGALPPEAVALLRIASVREAARRLGAKQVFYEEQTRTLRLLMPSQTEEFFYQTTFPKILDQFPAIGAQNIRLVSEGKHLRLVVRMHPYDDEAELLQEVADVLRKLTPTDVLEAAEIS